MLTYRQCGSDPNIVSAAYEDPEAFVPERWYSRKELVKDRRAFAPFGIGKPMVVPVLKHASLIAVRVHNANSYV